MTCRALARELLQPFVAGDALAAELAAIAREAFNFPAPLLMLDDGAAPGCARAVSRPDGRVQGLRRALSGRGADAAAARRPAGR